MPRLKSPPRQIIEGKIKYVRCPSCNYDFHRIMGFGAPEPGLDPRLLELECGRCACRFYVTVPYDYDDGQSPQVVQEKEE